jgi:hypothetical protein
MACWDQRVRWTAARNASVVLACLIDLLHDSEVRGHSRRPRPGCPGERSPSATDPPPTEEVEFEAMVDDFGLAISCTDQDVKPVVARDVLRLDPFAAGPLDGSQRRSSRGLPSHCAERGDVAIHGRLVSRPP